MIYIFFKNIKKKKSGAASGPSHGAVAGRAPRGLAVGPRVDV